MSGFAEVDAGVSPPRVTIPREYNAAVDFVDRNVAQGNAARTALIDDDGSYAYGELLERVNRAGNALLGLDLAQENRIAMAMLDTVDFPAVFWGAIKAGMVPIPLNTLLTTGEYAYMLRDSRARALVASEALLDKLLPAAKDQPHLKHIVVVGKDGHGHVRLDALTRDASGTLQAAATTADDVAFWLYSSGSTGAPKGAMHLQSDLVHTAALWGRGVLGITPEDVSYSAAKLFFAYGLGNAMTLPLHVGGTAVITAQRPTPDSVMAVMRKHNPTLFYGVPTLYGAILADAKNAPGPAQRLRYCVSAGEALPEDVGRRWKQRFGVDILDGIGSTEMLHIFLANRPGEVRYGTTGKPVPGYDLRILDEAGHPAQPGQIGELVVNGPSAAIGYWNQRAKNLHTFRGPWTYTGDKYMVDADGYYRYCGRSDDMMKVSGNWVSPFEVEATLIAHPKVLEAAVVGKDDERGLLKPKAYVVLRPEADGVDRDTLTSELKNFVKARLAPYKYPRWIEYVDTLPKTATGKIQRFKLRAKA
ncbi:MAG: benzoate-CoA ligase family protein [Alphaproteobacteria bacterium]|nr:benzoate-CoA ligase family protein [Alphaproteobacteria bacterium]